MWITALMWAVVILLGMLAVGFFICVVFLLFGMINQRKDHDMLIMFGVMAWLAALFCTGLVYVVISIWRNIP